MKFYKNLQKDSDQNMKWMTAEGDFFHRGTYETAQGMNLTWSIHAVRECGIVLFPIVKGKIKADDKIKIPFDDKYRMGELYAVLLKGLKLSEESYAYLIFEDSSTRLDPYAEEIIMAEDILSAEGRRKNERIPYGVIRRRAYRWGDDRHPETSYEDSLFYGLHVRGFTMSASSAVRNKGTFRGVVQKLSYLKQLGATGIVLQPVYDFGRMLRLPISGAVTENYWGYTQGHYFAPNPEYAATEDPCRELKDLVKAFHRSGMEVIMQLSFPEGVAAEFLKEILYYWICCYHMDGFSFVGTNLPLQNLITEDFLKSTKLISEEMGSLLSDIRPGCKQSNLAECRNDFMNTCRRFLKGDEDMLKSFLYQSRNHPDNHAVIHYMADFNTMRLYDSVAYDRKHNEANGEQNRDGDNYNYSWNCGAEGVTRKISVKQLRLKQMKNAACFLMLSQGVPYLYMGDEFADTSGGNNNPYNQDNETAWVNWSSKTKNKEFYHFVRELIAFRKAHVMLHYPRQMRVSDYLRIGFPDLSYHGEELWHPCMDSYIRFIAVMLCGEYGKAVGKETEENIYIAYNMHWEKHTFILPELPKDRKWSLAFSTEKIPEEEKDSKPLPKKDSKEKAENGLKAEIPERTVAVYLS